MKSGKGVSGLGFSCGSPLPQGIRHIPDSMEATFTEASIKDEMVYNIKNL